MKTNWGCDSPDLLAAIVDDDEQPSIELRYRVTV
jgi:hypothetical protein